MSVKHYYRCDLCGSDITDKNGIGIYHTGKDTITAKYLADEGCGHHLCNNCVNGLRVMIESFPLKEETRP